MLQAQAGFIRHQQFRTAAAHVDNRQRPIRKIGMTPHTAQHQFRLAVALNNR